ncbi:MAG TPA: methyltransferase domain-containing protein [Ktedonobacterales bacterium]
MTAINDPAYLLDKQYRDASNLNARIVLHRRFSTNKGDLHRWIFDHLRAALGPDARIVEVGCGPADLWRTNRERLPPGWHVTLTDFSPGMVEAAGLALAGHNTRFSIQQADAEALPFADGAFDAAVANYLLYHVPDRPRAIAELARVLVPGGRLFAATNGERHMRELDDLLLPHLRALQAALGASGTPDATATLNAITTSDVHGFTLENGAAQLSQSFAGVTLDLWDDALVVNEVEPLMRYIRSLGAGMAIPDDLMAAIQADVEGRIARDGSIRIGMATGLFTAANPD